MESLLALNVSYQVLHSMSMGSNLSNNISGVASLVTQSANIKRFFCFVISQFDYIFEPN